MIKNNNIFKKNKDFFLPFICTFCLILSLSIFVSFSNMEVQEVIVKSMTPVYDENSTVVITEDNGVIFNDKDQVVKYNVVLENTQNYDVKINDIKLSTPSEEFLKYEVEGIDKDDVIKANETKELVVSFKTVKMEGWGRNFSDELTANITFDKLKKNEESVTPEEDKDKEEPKQEEALPEEDKTTTENNTNNGTGNTEPDKKEETPIVESKPSDKEEKPQTNIDKNEPVIKEETTTVPDTNDTEEDINTESESIKTEHELKPAPETKEETTDTSKNTKTILIIVGIAAGVTGITIVLLNKNKFAKYTIFIIVLGSTLTITNAEDIIQLPVTLNVSYKSQNVMKPSGFEVNMETGDLGNPTDYWTYSSQIKNFYIENELNEITEYAYKFDVTEEQNGRVIAYLVERTDDSVCFDAFTQEEKECYDLLLQSDGVIYPNTDASGYFFLMISLTTVDNLEGFDTSEVTDMSNMFFGIGVMDGSFSFDLNKLDTSNVTNMSGMFFATGNETSNSILDLSKFNTSNVTNMSNMFACTSFLLDLSNFDTSNVTDMSGMFEGAFYNNDSVTIDLSNFDTSNVTDMSNMFRGTGEDAKNLKINLSNLDISNVTDMSNMFRETGYNSESLTIDLSNLNSSNVKDMSSMFYYTGYNSTNFTLDVSKFDTRNVTDMSSMFYWTGYNNPTFTLDISDFDTSNVTDMSNMFQNTGDNSTIFTLDVSNFDTSNVTNMSGMFHGIGGKNPSFTLDVSNFDTSNVTNMSDMFSGAGADSTEFTLDLSNFDTSNVTNMSGMFNWIGYNSTNFELDLSNFDTSNVTDMSWMFAYAGHESDSLKLDVSNFDTSNVTKMEVMFSETGYNSTTFDLDLSSFDTSNVTNMSGMFYGIAYNNPNFTLDVNSFDLRKVTDTSFMFQFAGYSSTKLNTLITISNPNISDYRQMFLDAAIKQGSQIKVNYTNETIDSIDKFINTKWNSTNIVKGKLIVDVDNLKIGDEIHISDEKFNVISQTDDIVTMLAQNSLSTSYKQSTSASTRSYVSFSDAVGWEYTPGPKEIDIQTWSTNPKTYVNEYVSYLQGETGDTTLSGDLITLTQLKELGCTINDDYSYNENESYTCANSQYADWLVNGLSFWTRSALSENGVGTWIVNANGILYCHYYGDDSSTIRPTITISKEALRKLN